MKSNDSHIELPSGLHLLSTRVGQVMTGKERINTQVETHASDVDNREACMTLDGQVNVAMLSPKEDYGGTENEKEMWEEFWALESAGTEEFVGSERNEQARIHQQLWEKFNETIEKRQDGYYVRLPWRQECHSKGHRGTSHAMFLMRENFWILKFNFPYKYPSQGGLPKERVERSWSFVHVRLDYFGPLSITQPNGGEAKAYGCIITCMVTLLVYLDIVADLSTSKCLMML
ncbi:hypothetical protein OESDEN_01543 [Oesophagostomum dentatum]|uniref:Uncharacterized protein n=1 Tax=Oesophagostomum dentatum TaxID=61180 RepID=A0A0B1TRK4_OESDE|nr:hypothetical protein OESDEN_01543 [Oesophagostomum dentatum]